MTARDFAQQAVDVLNRVHAADPTVLPALIAHRVPCHDNLVNDETVQVGRILDAEGKPADVLADLWRSHEVGLLGIINGIVGVRDDGWGYVSAVYDDDGALLRFELLDPTVRCTR